MRIPTKVECGIIALVDIAIHSKTEISVNVMNISKRNGISPKYLEQILPLLRNSNIINSVKGAKGGYSLSRPPEKISLFEIINAIDNSIICNTSVYYENSISETINEYCWSVMEGKMREFAENTSLSDIVDRCNERTQSQEIMYYI